MLAPMSLYLTDFRLLRPLYEHAQENILAWLAEAHTQAEARRSPSFDAKGFKEQLDSLLSRIGLGDRKVKKRGTQVADVGHRRWDEMELFQFAESSCIGKKTAFFGKAVDQFFEDFYPIGEPLPSDLVHVTCTGYLSPSGAQKLVASRKAGRQTTVTHAYHMGCYAAIPALRIAGGFVKNSGNRADIVHTELCSLHMDPYSHTPEQLVIQSLFGDGCIRYSVSKSPNAPSLSIIALRETTLPGTSEAMTWQPAFWGMQMSLKKEVPRLIADSIEQAVDDLASAAGLPFSTLQANALFAIHPGGPKIIETVASILKLQPNQYRHSCAILESYGNMSSATLPHIWESILNDPCVPDGAPIVSLGFGPGLTVASSLMKKELP